MQIFKIYKLRFFLSLNTDDFEIQKEETKTSQLLKQLVELGLG